MGQYARPGVPWQARKHTAIYQLSHAYDHLRDATVNRDQSVKVNNVFG